MTENIIKIDMNEEIEQSYIDYAMYVNTDRALPDVRDGMKPVHRRIEYATSELGLTPNKPFKKSARIVGDVIGRFHPHGDTSVYDAMVRMAQEWSLRYPLIEGQGNFGNIDGDGAAAMRYTEARLSKIAMEMIRDLKKDVVDFKLNFSDDEFEPTVLPARIPNLLLNGTVGIGVTLACSFASHNIVETMNAIKAQVKNPNITIEELHEILTAPDFPTGGIIINQNELLNAYKTGRGRARIRGKYRVETVKKKEMLVFYEIPYGVTKETLIESIAKLAVEKRIEGISDLRDSSNKNGMRIEIELKKGVNPDVMANQLFKMTRLEDTFSINQVCLVNGEPKLLDLKTMIDEYIKHQKSVLRRRSQFELNKINNRLHIVEGLVRALEDIDNVISLIKSSNSAAKAIEGLMEKYSLSEIQSKAIVDMKLRKLTGLEKVELEGEFSRLTNESNNLTSILSDEEKLSSLMLSEMDEILSTHRDERRTEVTNISLHSEEKDIQYVQPEDVVVVATRDGCIKKIPSKSFKVQNRNGKGVKNQEDVVLDIIKTNTIDTLMVFTALGKMYKLVVDQVPTGTNASRGTSIHSLTKMESHDKVIAITSMKRKTTAKFVVSVSEKGMLKKTKIEEFANAKRSGIIALGLKPEDKLAGITFIDKEEMLLVSENGMSIRFTTDSIASLGRTSIGVRAMKLADGDRIVAFLPINKKTDDLAIFTEFGVAKRTKLSEYPLQGRDGKGTITYKPTKVTGAVVSAVLVEDKDNVLLVGDKNSICVSAKDIPVLGKASIGNGMIKDSRVVSITKI